MHNVVVNEGKLLSSLHHHLFAPKVSNWQCSSATEILVVLCSMGKILPGNILLK